MIDSRVKALLAKKLTLPSLPAVVQKVTELLQDPRSGTREIAELVATDPPLAAKVLKIANSSFYGLRERCLSTEQASAVLGLKVLRNVVTQAAVVTQFDHLKSSGFDMDELWRHSIVTGQVASFLARRSKRPLGITPEETYTCGLLHDLGRVVMLENMREPFLEAARRAESQHMPAHACEEQTFGFNHADVGALVAQHWGLPAVACGAIQFHHGPREAVAREPAVALVANANLLVHRACDGNLTAAASTFDEATLRILGLNGTDVTDAVTFVEQSLTAVQV
jgi:putative nucleotidyltransferase with HDIG domain